MPTKKRYRQLKFEINELQSHYEMVFLSFKLNRHEVTGFLNGSSADWTFQSNSPEFSKIIPSGKLFKYALWVGRVPKEITKIYNGIEEAAIKAGFDIMEKEEAV